MSPSRRWSFRLGAVAVGIGIALVVLEVGLRMLGYGLDVGRVRTRLARVSTVPGLRFELVPSLSAYGWLTQASINSHGMRGPETTIAGDGRLRVAVLGDSIGFGLFVEQDETTSARLQSRLGPEVEVLNFSVTGYDTVQEAIQFEHVVLPFRPDVLVLSFCLNDAGVADEHMGSAALADRLHNLDPVGSRAYNVLVHTVEVAGTVGWFVFANWPSRFLATYRDWIVPLDPDPVRARTMAEAGTRHPILTNWYTQAPRLGRLRGALGHLSAAAEQAGVAPVLLLYPVLAEDGAEGYPYAAIHRLVTREARRAGIAVVDLAAAFRAVGMTKLRAYPIDDIHPGAAGHDLAAGELARFLRGWERWPPGAAKVGGGGSS